MSLKLIAATLLMALPAASADTPLPGLRIEPKAGGSIFFVKNVSSQPLTAYLVELVDYPGSSFSLWQDDIGSAVIAPGAEKRIEVANMTVGAVPDYVKMQAAVYADGTTAGIPEKVKQLIERRHAMLETARDLIRRLENAKEGGLPRETLIANLKTVADLLDVRIKTAGKSPFAVYQTASNKLIRDTATRLETFSIDDTLAELKTWEKAVADSKPAL